MGGSQGAPTAAPQQPQAAQSLPQTILFASTPRATSYQQPPCQVRNAVALGESRSVQFIPREKTPAHPECWDGGLRSAFLYPKPGDDTFESPQKAMLAGGHSMPSPQGCSATTLWSLPVFQLWVSLTGDANPVTIHQVLKHDCVLWREGGWHRDHSGVPFKGHNPSPSSPEWKGPWGQSGFPIAW